MNRQEKIHIEQNKRNYADKMDIDEIINEHIMILLNIFNNNYKHLTWSHVQSMLKTTLLLGIELGKKESRINRSIK